MEATKPTLKLLGDITGKSFSLREENHNRAPNKFDWVSGGTMDDNVFVVDGRIRIQNGFGKNPIALLVEPRALHPKNYEAALTKAHLFDAILTYDEELLEACDWAFSYSLGGSSIDLDKWALYPKSKKVCMFFSGKDTTPGHKLRREIVETFGAHIDIYGEGVGKPVDSKFQVLKEYEYCVVVESDLTPNYFSEKFIDPISVGTVPLYCGCRPEGYYSLNHAGDGIPEFKTIAELAHLLRFLPKIPDKEQAEWLLTAVQYAIMEDNIWNRHFGELF